MRDTRKKDNAPRGVFRHPSGEWAIRYVCGRGHVHQERIGRDKTEAKEEHAARRLRVRQDPGWCPRVERQRAQEEARRQDAIRPLTVREYGTRWLSECVAATCKPRTLENYTTVLTQHVYPILGDVLLPEVTREAVRSLLAQKAKEGLARETLRSILTPVRSMFSAAVEDGRVAGNPAVRLGRYTKGITERETRRATALTAEEVAHLLAMADREQPRYADLIRLLAWTGLRVGEACALQWGDLDFNGGFLEVRRNVQYRNGTWRTYSPKSRQARRVDAPTALLDRLHARRAVAEAEAAVRGCALAPDAWVFPAARKPHQPLNPAYLLIGVWYDLLPKAGLRAVRLHDLRHTYASLLLQAGESLAYVKEQLGHHSIRVTVDLYGHFVPGANRGAADRLAERTGAAPAAPGTAPSEGVGALPATAR